MVDEETQAMHALPPEEGGCEPWLDPVKGTVSSEFNACTQVDTEYKGERRLRRGLRRAFEVGIKKHFTDHTRSDPQDVENFVAEWPDATERVLEHCFGDHSRCDRRVCGYREDSETPSKYREQAVTCKPLQKKIRERVLGSCVPPPPPPSSP
jgi:hypothetical protein